MNRHIYGLTAFLVIVKTHLLIYWLFFAPCNFVSIQAVETETPIPVVKSLNCKMKPKISVALRNISISVREGVVFANVSVNNSRQTLVNDGLQMRLQIFDEEKNLAWSGEIKHYRLNYVDSDISITECSRSLARLNPKKNYYAKLVESSEIKSNSEFRLENLKESTPVLQIKDGIGIACVYHGEPGN